MPATEALAAELVRLVRGLRELGAAMRSSDGSRMDLPAGAVLGQVGDNGPLRLSDLADRLLLDLSTVSRQVPALERDGLLQREPDPCDRRASLLSLTDAGRAALAARRRAQAEHLAVALPDWSDDDVAHLAALLGRLNTDLSAHRSAQPAALQQAPALIAHDQKEAS
ncbi:MAG: transcriptional regulator, MarR family [Frankiales bacterium]|nr:transcriptional regulator, MarR family [Frankiales bacterium]